MISYSKSDYVHLELRLFVKNTKSVLKFPIGKIAILLICELMNCYPSQLVTFISTLCKGFKNIRCISLILYHFILSLGDICPIMYLHLTLWCLGGRHGHGTPSPWERMISIELCTVSSNYLDKLCGGLNMLGPASGTIMKYNLVG